MTNKIKHKKIDKGKLKYNNIVYSFGSVNKHYGMSKTIRPRVTDKWYIKLWLKLKEKICRK